MSRGFTELDAPMWRLVRQLYYEDKVVEAQYEAEQLGGLSSLGQDNNHLFAEAEARELGRQLKLRPWLTLEAIESEVGHHLPQIADIVATECEALSHQFGWDNRESTLVSLLSQDVEAPWMPGRWGYFVDKVPYDKVCLPHHLVSDFAEMRRTIRHEFMHGITLNLSQRRASRWVEEGFSTYAEKRLDTRTWQGFKNGSAQWLDPNELNQMLATDNRKSELHRAISTSYSQSNMIVRYLADRFGEPMLGEFLKELGTSSLLETLNEGLFSRSPIDSALHKAYHMSERGVFSEAQVWVRSSPVPSE